MCFQQKAKKFNGDHDREVLKKNDNYNILPSYCRKMVSLHYHYGSIHIVKVTHETSLAAKSEEKRMFSQAMTYLAITSLASGDILDHSFSG